MTKPLILIVPSIIIAIALILWMILVEAFFAHFLRQYIITAIKKRHKVETINAFQFTTILILSLIGGYTVITWLWALIQ